MIGERRPLSIKVLATAGGAVSSEAVSIGLIVTELVINALKHGFPAGAEGEILVSYDAQASGWRLSVSDNGSGAKELSGEATHAGLGTSIVEALAHQLQGDGREVERTGGHAGDNYSSGLTLDPVACAPCPQTPLMGAAKRDSVELTRSMSGAGYDGSADSGSGAVLLRIPSR
jgi:hypothetical protein